jgi:hypothetical protein
MDRKVQRATIQDGSFGEESLEGGFKVGSVRGKI